MIKVGRFRILFTRKGGLVKWYTISVGTEGKIIRAWKRKRRTDNKKLIREYCNIIILGMVYGQLI